MHPQGRHELPLLTAAYRAELHKIAADTKFARSDFTVEVAVRVVCSV